MIRNHQTGGNKALHSTVTSKRIPYIIDSTYGWRITNKRSSLRSTNVSKRNGTAIIGIVKLNVEINKGDATTNTLSLST